MTADHDPTAAYHGTAATAHGTSSTCHGTGGTLPPPIWDPVAGEYRPNYPDGTAASAYLAVHDNHIGWAGTDRDRAHEYARNTGAVVVALPVEADYRNPEGQS